MDSVRSTFSKLVPLVAVIVLSMLQFHANAAGTRSGSDPAALDLAKQVYHRENGEDMSSQVQMVLADKGGAPRTRLLYSYAKDKGESERWTLMRFIEPADIDGTGLLTKDYPGDESDQWLYLPALGRVRVISSSRKGGRFVGSDFFYEDLRDREVEMDLHHLEGTGKIGNIVCDLLVSTPKDPSNSVYSKRVRWIHRKTLVPLRVDFYQKGSQKPVKRMIARKLKRIQGYWTVLDSTMYDLKSGHQTKLAIRTIKYDQGLPDSLFTKQGLSDAIRELRYRPR